MIRFASFGRRTWGLVLDLLLDLLVLGALKVVTDGADVLAPFAMWYLINHVAFVVEGGSLGHRLAGLRIVRVDGGRVGPLHAIMREVVKLFLSLPPLGMGFLWMLDEPRRRTWHDLLAGSVVVRELVSAEVVVPEWADAPPWRAAKQSPSGEELRQERA
jgi:uncharacterized RDD family membrane protein YckC